MVADRRAPGLPAGGAAKVRVVEVGPRTVERDDQVASEEPLEVRVVSGEGNARASHGIAVTMRTPGDDFALATGFLVSEGIVSERSDLWRMARCEDADVDSRDNIVEAHLVPGVDFDPLRFSRHVYTTSSCGICGAASIERLSTVCRRRPSGNFCLDPEILYSLPGRMREVQALFSRTGGLHAAAISSPAGDLQLLREDVGRHNAVDKVVGACFLDGLLPLDDAILLVSGRASFELVQKALMAGIPVLAAVGAPSSLAVSTARDFGLSLIGFLKDGGFNLYSGEDRIDRS